MKEALTVSIGFRLSKKNVSSVFFFRKVRGSSVRRNSLVVRNSCGRRSHFIGQHSSSLIIVSSEASVVVDVETLVHRAELFHPWRTCLAVDLVRHCPVQRDRSWRADLVLVEQEEQVGGSAERGGVDTEVQPCFVLGRPRSSEAGIGKSQGGNSGSFHQSGQKASRTQQFTCGKNRIW